MTSTCQDRTGVCTSNDRQSSYINTSRRTGVNKFLGVYWGCQITIYMYSRRCRNIRSFIFFNIFLQYFVHFFSFPCFIYFILQISFLSLSFSLFPAGKFAGLGSSHSSWTTRVGGTHHRAWDYNRLESFVQTSDKSFYNFFLPFVLRNNFCLSLTAI